MIDCWIAIAGSVDNGRTARVKPQNGKEAVAAAHEIGRALAQKGCGLVVYSSDPGFLEAHVVHGYASSERATPNSIRVLYPRGSTPPSFSEYQTKPTCFAFDMSLHQNWEVSFYRSLHEVDGLLLAGGGKSSFVAGILATTRQMPLIALEPYGGTSADVFGLLHPGDGLIEQSDMTLMSQTQHSETWANAVVDSLLAQRQRRRDRDTQRAKQTKSYRWRLGREVLAALLLVALALVLVGSTWDAALDRTRLFAALLAVPAIAGMAASLARSVWDKTRGHLEPEPLDTWPNAALGCIAGAISGLLYVIAQLAAIAPTADGHFPAIASRLVPFALLTGFLAGFATDLFFRRMAERDIDPIHLPSVTASKS